MDPTPENLQLWIRPQMLLFWGRFHSTVIPIFPLLFHSSSLLSDVLALGHRGYKGHQINKHNFFSHANFITVAWGGCKISVFRCSLWKEDFFFHSIKTKTKKTKTKFYPERKAKGLLAQLFQSKLFHTPNSARAPHGKHGTKSSFSFWERFSYWAGHHEEQKSRSILCNSGYVCAGCSSLGPHGT